MQITAGPFTYEWLEDWAKLPAMTGHAHNGMQVSPDGLVYTGHATEPVVLVLQSTTGEILQQFDYSAQHVREVHGLTLGTFQGQDCLYIVNSGRKPPNIDDQGSIIISDLQGNVLRVIHADQFPGVGANNFWPTALACTKDKIFVTDGYASFRIFCFDHDWRPLWDLDGSAGAGGPLKNPHWIHLDERGAEPELYIADRLNDQVQIYGLDGSYRRHFGKGFLRTPSVFANLGDYLLIGELKARLVLVDRNDAFVAAFGDGSAYLEQPGWPNRRDAAGEPIAPTDLKPGLFNSPHGVATDQDGSIYVSEWLRGGRYRKLQRLTTLFEKT